MKNYIFRKGYGMLMLTSCALSILCASPSFAAPPPPANDAVDTSDAIQQRRTVTGTVHDENQQALVGVLITERGTSNTVVTDAQGQFSISVGADAVINAAFLGYTTQEITTGSQTSFSITMREDTQMIDEVVVIGYGTARKGDVTSSVASVKAESFNQGAVQDIGSLIQGKVAGLNISLPSGSPTASSQVTLRGRTTIQGRNTSPLVIIDGVPGDFNSVSPEDVESVDVLKDGSAAAIYGTRGNNGVIIITTKRASGDQINRVEYNAYVSLNTVYRQMDLLTAEDYRAQIAAGSRPASQDFGYSTDWYDQIMRTPVTHNHNMSFSGGNRQTSYIMNVTYRNTQGIIKSTDQQRLQVRARVNHRMFDNKLLASLEVQSNRMTALDRDANYAYRQALIMNPTAPVYNEKGEFGKGKYYEETGMFQYQNPVAMLNETDGRNKTNISRLSANLTYNPIKDLTLTALFAMTNRNSTSGISYTKNHISTVRDSDNGRARVSENSSENLQMDLTATYKKALGNHDFSVMGGYSYYSDESFNFSITNIDFPTDIFGYAQINLGEGINNKRGEITSSRSETNLIGFFGRAHYGFKNRYLFDIAARYEGASQLVGTNNEWGFFPSVGFGWRMSEEKFIRSLDVFSNLFLRLGYGVTGQQPDDSFRGMQTLAYSGYFLSNGKWVRTLSPGRNPNPHLKWEEKHEYNIGLDWSVLDGRLGGSIDWYTRETRDLLYNYTVPSPPNLVNSMLANVGIFRNRGLEILINAVPVQNKNFSWNTNVTFSTNRDKLVTLSNDLYKLTSNFIYQGGTGDPIQSSTHRIEIGGRIGDFFGFKVVDIDNTGKWIYIDGEGNRVDYDDYEKMRNESNKHVLGNGIPKAFVGWNNNFSYKNWNLGIMMRGQFDYQILNFQRMFYENPNTLQYNRIKSVNDPVFGKRALHPDVPLEYNSYYIENGDFWKIENVTLGYNFPKTGMRHIKSVYLYGSIMNLATITGYKGVDPDVTVTGLAPGNDSRDKYPTLRSFTFGAKFTF